ncbi:MAG: hypothetical protein ACUVWK_06880 [Nitrososphaerales archaeon]
MRYLKKKHVSALTLEPGPTESGVPAPPTSSQPVGGELLPNAFPILSQYWLLMILLLLPLLFLFYKKRSRLMPLFLRLLTR